MQTIIKVPSSNIVDKNIKNGDNVMYDQWLLHINISVDDITI